MATRRKPGESDAREGTSSDNGAAAWDIHEAPTGTGARAPAALDADEPALVLIVDDDADHRELCAHQFAILGCRVLAGADGQDALRLASECAPDLILLDLLMPGLDGIETTQRLRADARTRNVRIAGMTNLDAKWQYLARDAGCDVVVQKTDLVLHFERVARRLLTPGILGSPR